ncbi:MAG: CDP-glycerol glycerophosphotransferase family protein [bacterium]|nr:CDP-glycerol glycerophosphotransferase family protein [bacterium]
MSKKKYYYIFIFVLCLFLYQQPAFAYIDPGTGSMLFSIILGVSATLFFALRSLLLTIKSKLFVSKKLGEQAAPFVIYSEGKQYWCVFKPVIDEFEKRKIPLVYYTSAEDDFFFKENYKYVKGEFIGKGNKAYFKLAFLNADICLMTTPQLDVLQLKRSKKCKYYAHIFHSICYSGEYRLYALDYYDCVLCDAAFQAEFIREIEQKRGLPKKELPVVGCTYMDYFENIKNTIQKKNTDKKTVLIAPSWGDYSLLHRGGDILIKKLAETDYNIIIRPHPQSMIIEKDFIEKLMKKYQSFNNISWNFDSNNLEVLSATDVLISDFSCVMFDFAFLFNKPFIYVDTEFNFNISDIADLDEVPYKYKLVDIIGKGIKPEEVSNLDIKAVIEDVFNNVTVENIQKEKDFAWAYQGQSAQNVVDFLVNKQKELSKK